MRNYPCSSGAAGGLSRTAGAVALPIMPESEKPSQDRPPAPPVPGPTPASPAAGSAAAHELKNAMKAFKKRLKLARLDDESRLGYGAMSSGGRSGIVAIVPPAQYPQAVWDELVNQGKLRRAGHGLYELASERSD